jgi:hypothetical protein
MSNSGQMDENIASCQLLLGRKISTQVDFDGGFAKLAEGTAARAIQGTNRDSICPEPLAEVASDETVGSGDGDSD